MEKSRCSYFSSRSPSILISPRTPPRRRRNEITQYVLLIFLNSFFPVGYSSLLEVARAFPPRGIHLFNFFSFLRKRKIHSAFVSQSHGGQRRARFFCPVALKPCATYHSFFRGQGIRALSSPTLENEQQRKRGEDGAFAS